MKKRFVAIEGLRGWLAWTVVVDHCLFLSGIQSGIGYQAVLVFIIVSGFVITHLLIERPEPYAAYLIRRFFRLAPLLAVTSVAGYFAYGLPVEENWQTIAASQSEYFWAHVLAHATLLHGAISNAVLPHAAVVFNMPAWSLSLEWQFYFVAPLILWRRTLLPWFAALAVIGHWLFARGVFGEFDQPGLLLALAGYFGVGIASRLCYPHVAGKLQDPRAALALIFTLAALGSNRPLTVWLVVCLRMMLHPAAEGLFTYVHQRVLESRLALYFGSRSYSVYLSHFPVLVTCQWLLAPPNAFVLFVVAAPVTMAVSEILFRCVERPGIDIGARCARRYLHQARYQLQGIR